MFRLRTKLLLTFTAVALMLVTAAPHRPSLRPIRPTDLAMTES
jgi:hypothetical protein